MSKEEAVAKTLWVTAGVPTIQRDWAKLPADIKAHYLSLARAAIKVSDEWAGAES